MEKSDVIIVAEILGQRVDGVEEARRAKSCLYKK
jgi:hypothetical protein